MPSSLKKFSSVREMLTILESNGGLYLSDAVVSDALRLADEA